MDFQLERVLSLSVVRIMLTFTCVADEPESYCIDLF